MSDIAVKAGVSRSTVSFVLNKKHRAVGISEETRRRVLETASQMGYRRNEIARAMVTGKGRVLGFLVHAPEVEVAARLLAGALEEAETCGYFVKVIRIHDALDSALIDQCVELRLAGVMAVYLYGERLAYLHQEMARYRIPVAILDSSFPQERGVRVISDDLNGCRQAIDHLVGLGHRRIAFISGHAESGAGALREAGYQAAMERHALSVPAGYLTHGYFRVPDTEQAVARLLENPVSPPTAIFCADDKTALVTARTLRKRGLRVPEDVSVVGFADLTMAAYGDPPLTTVAQPFQEMGKTAVRHLLAARKLLREEGETRTCDEALPTRLIVRESTAPVHCIGG